MNQRCNNPKSKNFKDYGDRGIKVSSSLTEFKDYASYVENLPNYNLSLTLDRIDTNKDYEFGNLRWTTCGVQNANQRYSGKGKNRYTGVNWSVPHSRWKARINMDGKVLLTKSFHTEKDALEYRNQFIRENKLPHTIQVWTN